MSLGRFLRELSLVMLCVGCVGWAVTRWLVIPWVVVGPSMQPTLNDGDRVLVDLWTLSRRPPRPGEVVVFTGPSDEEFVKRVAKEPYPGQAPYPTARLATASPLEPAFGVIGDNLEQSLDSRSFGRVPQHRMRGRVFWRYWPLSRAGPIK